jgi:hypothetical protein
MEQRRPVAAEPAMAPKKGRLALVIATVCRAAGRPDRKTAGVAVGETSQAAFALSYQACSYRRHRSVIADILATTVSRTPLRRSCT